MVGQFRRFGFGIDIFDVHIIGASYISIHIGRLARSPGENTDGIVTSVTCKKDIPVIRFFLAWGVADISKSTKLQVAMGASLNKGKCHA
jgi:hypothetical protein